jgi:hypothetical protein
MLNVADVMAEPIAQQLLREVPILHLAYTGLDRRPRVIPIGYLWDGGRSRSGRSRRAQAENATGGPAGRDHDRT